MLNILGALRAGSPPIGSVRFKIKLSIYLCMAHFTIKQLEETLRRSICSGWDRAFLESIVSQLEKKKTLTPKQKTILGRVLAQNSSMQEELLHEWKREYFTHYYPDAIKAAYYHIRNPYYTEMAEDILSGKVPCHKRFMKMMNNKYTKKVLREHAATPRFKAGFYVIAKTNFDQKQLSFSKGDRSEDKFIPWDQKRKIFLDFIKKGGIIVAVDTEIHSAAKGATRYKILGIGNARPFYVEERFLKPMR